MPHASSMPAHLDMLTAVAVSGKASRIALTAARPPAPCSPSLLAATHQVQSQPPALGISEHAQSPFTTNQNPSLQYSKKKNPPRPESKLSLALPSFQCAQNTEPCIALFFRWSPKHTSIICLLHLVEPAFLHSACVRNRGLLVVDKPVCTTMGKFKSS
jgi:hypothetical protein